MKLIRLFLLDQFVAQYDMSAFLHRLPFLQEFESHFNRINRATLRASPRTKRGRPH